MLHNKTLSILFCFSIFSRGLFLNRGLFGLDIDQFAYPFYVFLFFYLILINKYDFIFFSRLLFLGLFLFLLYVYNDFPILGFLKIFLPMLIVLPTVYSYLKETGIEFFFKNYVKVSLWVAILGLIQFSLKLIAISIFSRYTDLVNLHSIVTEPSHYVVVILPACVFAYFYYDQYKNEFWILLISLVLTLKLTAFLSLFLIYILIKRGIRNWFFAVPIGYLFFLYLITFDQYSFRLLSTFNYLFFGEYYNIIHGTPLSFLSNLSVAIDSANNFIFGGGLGSHPYAYDLYFKNNDWFGVDYQFGMNKNSGHSLTVRILSEFGYMGLLIFLYFFFLSYNKLKGDKLRLPMFFAVLSHFIAKSIKLGGYIDFGTPIFLAIVIILFSKQNIVKANTK